ncbi:MAG: hypothetical protein ISS78_01965 [Phycisphaerae bacterium]|nr:hypothetical protein [Phycisphaerae bacterium]
MKHLGVVTALVVACVFAWSGLTADGQDRRGDGSLDASRPEGPGGRGPKHAPGPGKPPGLRRPHKPAGQPRRRGLSDAQEKELLAVLKDKRPELYERLIHQRQTDRLRYRWVLQMMWRWYERWKHLPEEIQDAAITEMDSKAQAWRLAREMRKAGSEGEKEQLLAKLRGVVAKQFDAEQKVRAHRLAQLEKQLKRAREELQARAKRRTKIIDELVERLIKGSSKLSRIPAKDSPARARIAKAERDKPNRRAPGGKDGRAGRKGPTCPDQTGRLSWGHDRPRKK